ncbi:hypothetical protein RUM44_003541 [Polyplax serrata]|uniref:Uncharacterized protein n=1 Tax=Polyplax serrata TaxID=468196 RepID=A0ABR1AGX6_POLSC
MVAVPMHPAVSAHHPGLQLQHHPAAPAVHVTGPIIGLPPPHLGAIRSYVAAQQSPQRTRKIPAEKTLNDAELWKVVVSWSGRSQLQVLKHMYKQVHTVMLVVVH